ncbi:MAG: ATP synthase subunit I [Steroidobacteraceae bacterium]|nr:ATP synthase subunit I [Steroidobacteraceae bacterium]MDW8258236.1 ATP synthase subunit I [Gammaproteobacteria bacterium]
MIQPLQVTSPAARRSALSVIATQAAITALVAAVAWALAGVRAGWSALLGGSVSVAASLALWALAFRLGPKAEPRALARAFYLGEATKYAVTVALLVVALQWLRPAVGWFIGAFAATLLAYWLALAGVGARR